MRRLLLLAAIAAMLPAPALGKGGHYGVTPGAWNGMSQLTEIARRVHVQLRFNHTLDWTRLKHKDVLLIVYPTTPLPGARLDAFLRDGGRVIIADDFGKSADYLQRWGLRRVPPPIQAQRTYQGMPNLPVLEPRRTHFLFSFIKTIVTNHPVAYRPTADGWTIHLSFLDPREGFLLERTVERGRLLVVSDPSVLINLMLEFDDNFQFAANLALYFCRTQPCRLRVILPDASHHGTYSPQSPTDLRALRQFLATRIAKLNRQLTKLGRNSKSQLPLVVISVVCLIGCALMVVSGVLGRALPRRFAFQHQPLETRSGFGFAAQLALQSDTRADFADPLLRLRRLIDERLATRGLANDTDEGRRESARRLSQLAGRRMSAAQIAVALHELHRAEITFDSQLTYRFVSFQEFDRIFQLCRPVLEVLADER